MKKVIFGIALFGALLSMTANQKANAHTLENNGIWDRRPDGTIVGCKSTGEECYYIIPRKV